MHNIDPRTDKIGSLLNFGPNITVAAFVLNAMNIFGAALNKQQ